MKKLLSYLLVIALVLVQVLPVVNAEDTNKGTSSNTTGKITITLPENAPETEYKIYQILELESWDESLSAYTYKVTSDWASFFATDAAKVYFNVDEEGVATWVNEDKSDETVKEFVNLALAWAEEKNISATDTKTVAANTEKVVFEKLTLGYYLIDSSLGSLCILNTTNSEIEVTEKNGVPTVDKEVQEDSSSAWGSSNHADIGQIVNFRTKITAQAGAQDYTLYDNMSEGLTYNGVTSVTLNETEVDKDYYTVSTDDNDYTFVVTFSEDFEKSLKANDKIVVYYNATVNENATIVSTGNPNETWLEYGDENETTHDYTRTYTFSFDLIKKRSDGTELVELEGAEFSLYKEATGGTAIALVELKDEEGNIIGYRVATVDDSETTTTIKVGSTTIKGLDEDTYYLEETKAPEGYNKLTSRVEVKLDATVDATTFESQVVIANEDIENVVDYNGDEVNVINTTGSLLPSTGGMGTVLFITVGSIMVLGFGVLLVTKLRLSKMEI